MHGAGRGLDVGLCRAWVCAAAAAAALQEQCPQVSGCSSDPVTGCSFECEFPVVSEIAVMLC